MALTRKSLKAMGLTDEQVDSIVEMHTETVDGLKNALETAQGEAKDLPGVREELRKATEDLEAARKDGWQDRYNQVKKEFDDYKTAQGAKETHAAKEKAYRALLKAAGVSDKRLDSILRVSDVDGVELDESGGIAGADKLTESIKSEWADFISTSATEGANTATPPAATPGRAYSREDIRKMSPAEINNNWDAVKASLKSKGD